MHAAVCDYILDLFQNSVEAESSIIRVILAESNQNLMCQIDDNGIGMNALELKKALDPFYTDGKKHDNRRFGLGIPFLAQMIEMTNGIFDLKSEKSVGTSISFQTNKEHIDTPPVGDIVGLLISLFCFDGNYELKLCRSFRKYNMPEKRYELSKNELQDVLGNLNQIENLHLLKTYIQSQEDELLENNNG